jgi:hypothetical protein
VAFLSPSWLRRRFNLCSQNSDGQGSQWLEDDDIVAILVEYTGGNTSVEYGLIEKCMLPKVSRGGKHVLCMYKWSIVIIHRVALECGPVIWSYIVKYVDQGLPCAVRISGSVYYACHHHVTCPIAMVPPGKYCELSGTDEGVVHNPHIVM